ncbi:MAG: hypothetical protein JWN01_20 [Patescibacteria group bacterium]|nr:hypothetical protein [Patescibacteria group bacterium]
MQVYFTTAFAQIPLTYKGICCNMYSVERAILLKRRLENPSSLERHLVNNVPEDRFGLPIERDYAEERYVRERERNLARADRTARGQRNTRIFFVSLIAIMAVVVGIAFVGGGGKSHAAWPPASYSNVPVSAIVITADRHRPEASYRQVNNGPLGKTNGVLGVTLAGNYDDGTFTYKVNTAPVNGTRPNGTLYPELSSVAAICTNGACKPATVTKINDNRYTVIGTGQTLVLFFAERAATNGDLTPGSPELVSNIQALIAAA